MKYIKPDNSNLLLKGEHLGAGDLHCYLAEAEGMGSAIYSLWEPGPAEREAIANGMPILLCVFGRSAPPVWVGVSTDAKNVVGGVEE